MVRATNVSIVTVIGKIVGAKVLSFLFILLLLKSKGQRFCPSDFSTLVIHLYLFRVVAVSCCRFTTALAHHFFSAQ
jgi:hypothetical protein